MGMKTPLYTQHQQANGQFVDFAGWEMPIHYGSLVEEHHQVRKDAGMFDVSHMTIIDIKGRDATIYLQYLLANDVGRLNTGEAMYSCMLNDTAGIIDDLIVYHCTADHYRLVVNAATRSKDLEWIGQRAQAYTVDITECSDLVMLAIQGPNAITKTERALTQVQREMVAELKRFHLIDAEGWFIARTGYTGEDGLEIILPASASCGFWQALLQAGISPCGLGARNTLRLEAGLNLYGSDMDETVSPLESNLAWTIAWQPEDRDFVGREALYQQRHAGVTQCLRGIILEQAGVLRDQQKLICETGQEGVITSGSFSPTLKRAIALARVPVGHGNTCSVEMRGKQVAGRFVKPPFVREGAEAFKIIGGENG